MDKETKLKISNLIPTDRPADKERVVQWFGHMMGEAEAEMLINELIFEGRLFQPSEQTIQRVN
jgi:hypothetical protein